MPESIRNFHSPPPARLDRWDYSADIEMHILSLHADEILQYRFISNILRWFGFNWRIQLQCKNPYPANWSLLIDVCISSWGTRPALQRCHGINLAWGYTWNYQLSEAVIWLTDVNRAGVGWGLSSDGDLHRADYFSIIHLQQNIVALSRASGVNWSNQIIRDADHSHCQLINGGAESFCSSATCWCVAVLQVTLSLATFLVWGILTCTRGHLWPLRLHRVCSSCCSAANKEMSGSRLHFDQSSQYSAFCLEQMSLIWSKYAITVEQSIWFNNIGKQEHGLSLPTMFQVFLLFFFLFFWGGG